MLATAVLALSGFRHDYMVLLGGFISSGVGLRCFVLALSWSQNDLVECSSSVKMCIFNRKDHDLNEYRTAPSNTKV